MVEPVTVVVVALLAGASAVGKAVVGEGVKDLYAQVKDRVLRRVADRPRTQQALESVEAASRSGGEQPDTVARAVLEEQVRAARLDHDTEIADTARALLRAVSEEDRGTYIVDAHRAQGVQVGPGNHQANTFGSATAGGPHPSS